MRFPEFQDVWEVKKLGEVAPLQRGFDLPVDNIQEGEYPVVFSNGILKFHKEFKAKGPGVVTGRSGTIGKVTFVENDYWPHNTSLWVTDFKLNIPKFIYYFYSKYNLERFATGSGVPTLNRNDVHIQNDFFPSSDEQQKIATFLSQIDERIQTQNKIIDNLKTLIKGTSEKLLSQKLRFEDENGLSFPNWKVKKLMDIANRITNKNKENNLNVLTISAQFGLISQLEFFNKSVSSKDVRGYYLLNKNDFAYNKSYSNGYPMGAIKRLSKYDKGVVSTLYICFRFTDSINFKFMAYYFETGVQNSEIEKLAQEGARNHGLLNIGVSDFFSINLHLPSYPEQTKIANFLSSIDEKIEIEKQLLTQYENQKKYLLQNMFV